MAKSKGKVQPVVASPHGQLNRISSVQFIQQPNVMTNNNNGNQATTQPVMSIGQHQHGNATYIQTDQSPTSNAISPEMAGQSAPQPMIYIISAPQQEPDVQTPKPLKPCYYCVSCFFAVFTAILYCCQFVAFFSKAWVVTDGVRGGLFQMCFEAGVDTNVSWGFTITPDEWQSDNYTQCELTTDIITTGQDKSAVIMMSFGTLWGGVMLMTYICTGASVLFQFFSSALLVAASEHFVSGIVDAGFSRSDLGLAYLITMAVAVNYGLFATVRIGCAGAMGILTVTLRPRNVAFKSKKRHKKDSEEVQQAAPVIIQMAQDVPVMSSPEAVPDATLKEEKSSPVVIQMAQDVPVMSSPETVLDVALKEEQIQDEHARIRTAQNENNIDVEQQSDSAIKCDEMRSASKPSGSEYKFPAWLSWILTYLCCIKPISNKVGVVEETSNTSQEDENPKEAIKELLPCPFCCFPRSMMCDCVTGSCDVAQEPSRREVIDARLNLSCCGRLAPIPENLLCCVVVTTASVHPVSDATSRPIDADNTRSSPSHRSSGSGQASDSSSLNHKGGHSGKTEDTNSPNQMMSHSGQTGDTSSLNKTIGHSGQNVEENGEDSTWSSNM